jgi:glycosyltransferase involved in cell wall biosynthesis
MSTSIVVRAFNEGRHLPRLLEGLRQQTLQEVEVILVDSGSMDDTVAVATTYGARVVHISPQEFTFGRSLNLGVQAATGELVVIASAHVYPVYPDWLERLLEPLQDAQVALSYGKQRGMETTRFSEHQIFALWFPEQSQPRQAHPFCNNANACIRRALWQEHPYDETLTGLEDLAWAKWALGQGHTLAYVAEAEIIHVHDEQPAGVFRRYEREAMAFKRIYPEAHFSLYDVLRMVMGNVLSDVRHAARQRVLWSSFASIVWFRWMQFWGTYRGYRQSAEWNWQLRQTFYYPRGMEAEQKPGRDVERIRYKER